MNAVTADEKEIWIAVYAGECVWSRRAAATTSLKDAYQAAENAVLGFREIEIGKATAAQDGIAAAAAAEQRKPRAEARR